MSTDFLILFFPFLKRCNLNKKDWQILEMLIFFVLHEQLCLLYQEKRINEKEDVMISAALIKGLIKDLLINQEYSVEGLANYTGYPEDVILDLASGINLNPTLALSAKIFELHALARKDFYQELVKHLLTEKK